MRDIWHKYHSWYFKIVSNFTRLKAREITYNNFEISPVVFMPNITTIHATTYTNKQNFPGFQGFQFPQPKISRILESGFPCIGRISHKVRTLFWPKKSRTFQGLSRTHFPFFEDSIQCKEEPWVYVFFSSSRTWAILSWRSFCVCWVG